MKMEVVVPAGLDGFMAGIASDLEFGRQQLVRHLTGLTTEQLEAVPPGLTNSIATLVVHICATEVAFAYRLKGEQVPDELKPTYLLGQQQDRLPVAQGESVESLMEKMRQSRAILLETLAALQGADLDEELPVGPDRTATRRWFLALLPYHQAWHLGHLFMMKKLITQ